MAVAYITEYADQPIGTRGLPIPMGAEPPVATQTVAIGGTSTQSLAFNSKTKFIRLHVDAICSFLIGTAPTATAASPRIAANTSEFFGVNPGDKIAVITNT